MQSAVDILRQLRHHRLTAYERNGIEDGTVLFPLLPTKKVKRVFITLDGEAICSLHNQIMDKKRGGAGMSQEALGVNVFARLFGFFDEDTYRFPRSRNYHCLLYTSPSPRDS